MSEEKCYHAAVKLFVERQNKPFTEVNQKVGTTCFFEYLHHGNHMRFERARVDRLILADTRRKF